MKVFVYVLAMIAGASLSLEAAIGGTLGSHIGEIESSYYIFIIGSMVTFLLTLYFGKGDLKQVFKVPKWNVTGGLLGVIYLTLLVVSVNALGVGISVTAVIIGQIVMSMLIEHFGVLHTPKIRFNVNRLIALILLFISLYLVF